MTRTLGGTNYVVLLRADRRATGAPCVIAEDPRVPGAVGYGDDEEDARDMLDLVRSDILARAELAALKTEDVGAVPRVVSNIVDGWSVIWGGARPAQHA